MDCEQTNTAQKKSHKQWRKDAKKLRRKIIRRRVAIERDRKAEEAQAKLISNPVYQAWLRDQEELEKYHAEVEQREHNHQEEQWMRRELLAQKRFREEKKRQQVVEEAKEKERQRIQKEFEEQQNIIKERIAEKKRLAEEQRKRHELLLRKIDEFINESGELPPELYEFAHSNPGKEPCPFFVKTASCRFGDNCVRNHSRPGVSRVLLLRHFFTHIRLDQPFHSEYGTDLALEYSETELYLAYDEFFADVTEELSKYGEIVNFRTCKNTVPHLRGNVLIEFQNERSSLKAYRQLLGRYYACRRINVEFCKLISWKAAICGLSLTGTCPKGSKCNYLHIFKNPGNKYNVKDVQSERSSSRQILGDAGSSKRTPSWNEDTTPSHRHWRWSESPEPDMSQSKTNTSSKHNSRRSSPKQSSARETNSMRSRRRSASRSRSGSSPKSKHRSRSRSNNSKREYRNRSKSKTTRSKRARSKSRNSRQQSRMDSKSPNRKDCNECKNENSKMSRSRSKSQERSRRRRRRRSKSKSRKKK